MQRDVDVVGIELAGFEQVGFRALQIVVGSLQRRANPQELGLRRTFHIQLVDLLLGSRELLVRCLVIAVCAIEFGQVQPQLNRIELSFGHAARRQRVDRRVVFGNGIGSAGSLPWPAAPMACRR